MDDAKLDLRTLKETLSLTLDSLIERRGSDIFEVRKNNYWDVLGDDLFDVNTRPDMLEVGSLFDDIDFLVSNHDSIKRGETPNVYSLVHAVPLLRYIVETFSKSDHP